MACIIDDDVFDLAHAQPACEHAQLCVHSLLLLFCLSNRLLLACMHVSGSGNASNVHEAPAITTEISASARQ